MTSSRRRDALIEAIRANPDDDAPRLVWADREGGERGELVVVQCALAASVRPPRDELARLYAREAELLRAFPGAVFERGFATSITLGFLAAERALESDPELSEWPLVRTVHLPDTHIDADLGVDGAWGPDTAPDVQRVVELLARLPSPVTGLGLDPSIDLSNDVGETTLYYTADMLEALAKTKRGPKLRALWMPAILESFEAIEPFTELEELRVAPRFDWRLLGANAPKLRRLRLEGGVPSAELIASCPALVDLDLYPLTEDVARALTGVRLTSFAIRSTLSRAAKEALAASDALAGLQHLVFGDVFDDEWAAILPRARFASTLRSLRFEGWTARATPEWLRGLPGVEHLHLSRAHGHGEERDDLAPFRPQIPRVTR